LVNLKESADEGTNRRKKNQPIATLRRGREKKERYRNGIFEGESDKKSTSRY